MHYKYLRFLLLTLLTLLQQPSCSFIAFFVCLFFNIHPRTKVKFSSDSIAIPFLALLKEPIGSFRAGTNSAAMLCNGKFTLETDAVIVSRVMGSSVLSSGG